MYVPDLRIPGYWLESLSETTATEVRPVLDLLAEKITNAAVALMLFDETYSSPPSRPDDDTWEADRAAERLEAEKLIAQLPEHLGLARPEGC